MNKFVHIGIQINIFICVIKCNLVRYYWDFVVTDKNNKKKKKNNVLRVYHYMRVQQD